MKKIPPFAPSAKKIAEIAAGMDKDEEITTSYACAPAAAAAAAAVVAIITWLSFYILENKI